MDQEEYQEECEVEKIVDYRLFDDHAEYKVRWMDYGAKFDTWHRVSEFETNEDYDLITQFWAANPTFTESQLSASEVILLSQDFSVVLSEISVPPSWGSSVIIIKLFCRNSSSWPFPVLSSCPRPSH